MIDGGIIGDLLKCLFIIYFSEVFGKDNIEICSFGNVLSATALLHGLSAENLTNDELLYKDSSYQILITIKAFKR